MVASFDGNPSTAIISCYSPTNISDETNLITFYNDLSSLFCTMPKHNVLITGRVLNDNIGKNVNNKFSLRNSSNRNGEHLADFTQEDRLTCLNSKFQKKKGQLWIYTNANNTKAQIDYILINKKWNNSGCMEVRPDRWNKMQFFPSASRVDIAIWMHHMEANRVYGEKAWG